MKYITFAVPSYNSEIYMRRCIDSLLIGGEDVEILIINDGSTDKTGEIAEEYEAKYPTICKAVQKENGGHGSGVNKGLELATGLYYKIVDSDDWLDSENYPSLLAKIKEMAGEDKAPDLFIANYVYDHLDEGKIKRMSMRRMFPENELITWNGIKMVSIDRYLMIHNMYYKTSTLRSTGLKLPEHTFYVDGIFATVPLPYCRTVYYMDLDVYHYYIGRADQSVNTEIMCKRIDQFLRVGEVIEKSIDYKGVSKTYPKLGRYLYQYLELNFTESTAFLDMIGDEEAMAKKEKLWNDLKEYDENLYKKIRRSSIGRLAKLPPHEATALFEILKKIFKF